MNTKKLKNESKVQAAMFADNIISDQQVKLDPKVKALSRNALIAGWVAGYAAALADVVVMRDVAGAVKH